MPMEETNPLKHIHHHTLRRAALAGLLACAASLLTLPAQANVVEVSGVKYEPVQEVAGTKLQLNGAGTRFKAVFKVYAAGLYLTAPANSPEAVAANTGPKRLHIVALREVDGNDLGKLFTQGIQNNASREEFLKAINGITRIAGIFSTKNKLATGEHFTVDYIPGTGTQVLVNGKPTGEPIKEPEFYNVFLKIWLGKSPADDQLKDALLGIKRESRQRG